MGKTTLRFVLASLLIVSASGIDANPVLDREALRLVRNMPR